MDFTCFLSVIFALFPAYVTCLENYEGSMPNANLQRVSARIFPVPGSEVKQIGNWNDPVYASAPQRHFQDTKESYVTPKDRLFAGSALKSDSNDCHTSGKSDNQDHHLINYKPSLSFPKYDLSGFGQPSVLYESRKDAFKAASTSSQSGSTLRTLNVPSRGESSYEFAKTAGSNEISVVKNPKNMQSYMKLKSEVTRGPLATGPNRGPTSISGQISNQYTSSKGSQSTSKLQPASSSYGPIMKGNPVYSRMNPIKPSYGGFKYTGAKPLVVSSGPIFVVQGEGNAKGLGGYSGHPESVKPLGGPSHINPYQASNIYRSTESSQGKLKGKPLHYSTSGTQYSPSSEPRKPSKNDCRNNDARSSIASSGRILLKAPESAQINKMPPHYEATHNKFQQTYDLREPNKISKPVYPSQSWAQRDVPKSSLGSSGAIMIQVPANVQNRAESNKPKVYPIPERKVPFASGPTPQYQSGYQASSVKETQYKPSSVPSRPSTGVQSQDGSRRIAAVPSEFGRGTIRRTSPTLSSSYRQVEQNQPQVNSLDSLASKCEVTQNSPAGFGQQGPVRFQEANLSI
ncbi:uncharacterized protein zgc:175136 isoform X2 [Puntigrus tetrazona]|uniref:uncharacterized protein zgc:175136 isoform X2 n=1 Tax=Puntigrus tetrazona TaxID=1606681 RepID=UPI001C8AFE1E|nr:uncharacterized protein zgc:175136 isoform X2 [Puntigrus tetrazona]